MASYVTAKKNAAWRGYFPLIDQSNTKLAKANPTIASGDFKVSTDGAAFANLTTLPSVVPSGGRTIQIDLSAPEMNGDNVVIQCVDAAGAEWCDLFIPIQTTLRQIDDLTYGAPAGASTAADIAAIKSDTGTILTDVNTGGGALYTRIGAPVGASIAADIAAAKSDTAAIKTQTDKMTFTITNQLDVNVLSMVTSLRPGIRRNTALANFEFTMTDSTNHNPATGLTVSVARSIDGGSFSAGTLSSVTPVSNGVYRVDIGSGDMAGTVITLRATATGADDLDITFITSP